MQAHMDLNEALLGCNVSNNYTIAKNTPKYDTRNLIVQCKLTISCFTAMLFLNMKCVMAGVII